jgi:hypothetical protein
VPFAEQEADDDALVPRVHEASVPARAASCVSPGYRT